MAFKMAVSNEQLEGKDVMPAGLYKLRFEGFKPKKSKPNATTGQSSINFNAQFIVIDNPEFDGSKGEKPRKVFDNLNQGAGWVLQDFSHALGYPMETDGTNSWFAGEFDGDEANPETWTYKGPLLGQIAEVELAIDSYNGKGNNKISRYICRVPECAQKFPKLTHSMNLLGKK